jgi:hypothetical protein
VQRTQQEFWKRWIEEVFPELLKQTRWKQGRRDLKVGDIVLRKDETAAGQTYKYAKVVKVYTSEDGKVRAADIEYKLPGESVCRVTTRPIHKLVLVVPAEEQVTTNGKAEEEGRGDEQPAPLPAARPRPEQQKEAEAGEVTPPAVEEPRPSCQEETGTTGRGEDPLEAVPLPDKKKQGGPNAVVKYKKVTSRKKAGQRARTIVVSVPKEEGEIVDIGARPRKRGRPRKNPSMDPPDPHKGSVPDPGEGGCADPVNGGAILGKGGQGPNGGNKERQLSPDKGRRKT